jgi:hypothetical protein
MSETLKMIPVQVSLQFLKDDLENQMFLIISNIALVGFSGFLGIEKLLGICSG